MNALPDAASTALKFDGSVITVVRDNRSFGETISISSKMSFSDRNKRWEDGVDMEFPSLLEALKYYNGRNRYGVPVSKTNPISIENLPEEGGIQYVCLRGEFRDDMNMSILYYIPLDDLMDLLVSANKHDDLGW